MAGYTQFEQQFVGEHRYVQVGAFIGMLKRSEDVSHKAFDLLHVSNADNILFDETEGVKQHLKHWTIYHHEPLVQQSRGAHAVVVLQTFPQKEDGPRGNSIRSTRLLEESVSSSDQFNAEYIRTPPGETVCTGPPRVPSELRIERRVEWRIVLTAIYRHIVEFLRISTKCMVGFHMY